MKKIISLMMVCCTLSVAWAVDADVEKEERVTAPLSVQDSQESAHTISESSTEVQEERKKPFKNAFMENPNAVGFNGLYPLTGGLTYHRWIDTFGLGITAGGVVTNNLNFIDYNVQLSLQGMVLCKDVTDWFSTVLYLNAVIGHRGSKMGSSEIDFKEWLGFGIGTEFLFAKYVSFTLDCLVFGGYPWELTMGGGASFKIRFP